MAIYHIEVRDNEERLLTQERYFDADTAAIRATVNANRYGYPATILKDGKVIVAVSPEEQSNPGMIAALLEGAAAAVGGALIERLAEKKDIGNPSYIKYKHLKSGTGEPALARAMAQYLKDNGGQYNQLDTVTVGEEYKGQVYTRRAEIFEAKRGNPIFWTRGDRGKWTMFQLVRYNNPGRISNSGESFSDWYTANYDDYHDAFRFAREMQKSWIGSGNYDLDKIQASMNYELKDAQARGRDGVVREIRGQLAKLGKARKILEVYDRKLAESKQSNGAHSALVAKKRAERLPNGRAKKLRNARKKYLAIGTYQNGREVEKMFDSLSEAKSWLASYAKGIVYTETAGIMGKLMPKAVYTKGYSARMSVNPGKLESLAEDVVEGFEDITGLDDYDEAEQAKELTRKWHGRENREAYTVEESLDSDTNLAHLGILRELHIEAKKGKPFVLMFEEDPILAGTPDARQLVIVGGDQGLDLEDDAIQSGNLFELGENTLSKRWVPIGHIKRIDYFADKHHLTGPEYQKEGAEYKHNFGEVNGILPILMYSPRLEQLKIVGGDYTIEDVGITN